MGSENIEIALDAREVTGKQVKHLRKEGKIPAVIHNHGKESLVVQGDFQELVKVYRQAGRHHPVQVKAGGKVYTTLIKKADFEPKKNQLTHIVFNAVKADQKVEAEIPVEPKFSEGNESSPAERSGLLVLANLEAVTVEAVPSKLPDVIYYDAEKLVEVGDHVLVSELLLPADVVLKADDPNQPIATVFEPSAVAAANDAAGGQEEEEAAGSDTEEGGEENTEEE